MPGRLIMITNSEGYPCLLVRPPVGKSFEEAKEQIAFYVSRMESHEWNYDVVGHYLENLGYEQHNFEVWSETL